MRITSPLSPALCLASVLSLFACEDNSSDSSAQKEKSTHIMGMGIGTGSFYGTFSISAKEVTGEDFYEHDAQSIPFAYGKWVFIAEVVDGSDNLTRYTLNGDNNMQDPVELSFGGGSQPSNLFIVDGTKAFVSLGGAGKIAIINPTTMKKTGEIDISSYAAGGDGNPDPASGIIRDDILYLTLSQKSTLYSAWDTAACVLLVDIHADTVMKMITDDRANALGGPDDGHRVVFMDEDRDIYVYSNAVWGYQKGLHDGFLRIRDGQTEFDPDYYFSIKDTRVEGVEGNAATYGLCFAYASNAIAYSMLQIPALTSNPPDYVNDRNYQPVRINFKDKSITALPSKPSTGWASMGIVMEDDGNVVFGMATEKGNGLYRYHSTTASMDNEPFLATIGAPTTLIALED